MEEKGDRNYPDEEFLDEEHAELSFRCFETKQPAEETQTFLRANMLQVAVLNKMLPKGFKFELNDNVIKQQMANQQSKRESQLLLQNIGKEGSLNAGIGVSSDDSQQDREEAQMQIRLTNNRSILGGRGESEQAQTTRTTPDNQCLSCYPYSFVSTQLRSESDSSEAELNY